MGVKVMVNSTIRDIERERADFAFKCAREVEQFKCINSNGVDGKKNTFFVKALENKFIDDNEDDDPTKNKKREEIIKFINNGNGFEKLKAEDLYKFKKSFQKDYKSYVKKMPMYIKTNGLGATLAFYFSKSKTYNAYQLINQQILAWLTLTFKNTKLFLNFKADTFAELIDWVLNLDSREYKFVTIEVLSFLNWLRRFTDGLIEGENNGDGK